MHDDRPPLSIPQQIQLLKDKGLLIPDEGCAGRYLANIGFTRLLAYRVPFFDKDNDNKYKPGTTFQDTVDLYLFDRKLRHLCMTALDRIEISTRTVISNTYCERRDSRWIIDPDNFNAEYQVKGHKDLLRKIVNHTNPKDEDRKDPLCRDYFTKFTSPETPPMWVLTEVLPMGCWSIIYSNLRKVKFKKIIADHYGFDHDTFGNWLHALTLVRNICAHHSRLWNRKLPPKATKVAEYTHDGINTIGTYSYMAMMYSMIRSFTTKSEWHLRLHSHIEKCPLDIHTHMGFPINWEELSFWGFYT